MLSVSTPSEWFKGQRCPVCDGARGKVIAYCKNILKGSYGGTEYRYERWTHRVELKELITVESGPRKGFQYFKKKRKYCLRRIAAHRVYKMRDGGRTRQDER